MYTGFGAPFGVSSSFGVMGVIVPLFFLLVIGIVAGSIIQGIGRWNKNNNSPRLTVDAQIIARRTHVWGDHSHTNYYATFQFESGDRLELEVPDHQFGYLVEGDRGKLTFQGTRFLGFERQ